MFSPLVGDAELRMESNCGREVGFRAWFSGPGGSRGRGSVRQGGVPGGPLTHSPVCVLRSKVKSFVPGDLAVGSSQGVRVLTLDAVASPGKELGLELSTDGDRALDPRAVVVGRRVCGSTVCNWCSPTRSLAARAGCGAVAAAGGWPAGPFLL